MIYMRNLEQRDSIYEICHSQFSVQKEDGIFAFISSAANMLSIERFVSVWQRLFLIILMPQKKRAPWQSYFIQ